MLGNCRLRYAREIVLTRAIISDIDGTLIYRGHSLNKTRLPLMLEKLNSANIAFCLSTGRTQNDVRALIGDLSQGIYISSCDGALTTLDERIISEYPINDCCVEFFFAFTRTVTDTRTHSPSYFGIELHGLYNSYICTSSSALFHKEKARLKNLVKINEISQVNEKIYKVSLYGKNIPTSPESVRLCYSGNGIYEYVDRSATKLQSAKDLSEHLSSSLDNFIAFGDSENDLTLLTACGKSYSTYCASRDVFKRVCNHTRDVIGTVIRLVDEKRI